MECLMTPIKKRRFVDTSGEQNTGTNSNGEQELFPTGTNTEQTPAENTKERVVVRPHVKRKVAVSHTEAPKEPAASHVEENPPAAETNPADRDSKPRQIGRASCRERVFYKV